MASTYDIGDVTHIFATFTTTVDVDPGTVALVLELPDRTVTTYTYAGGTVTKDSVGHYSKDVALTVAGTHQYRWTSTGTGAGSAEGWFQVRPRKVA